ncbi:MAG TPA: hypothetical protein VM265_06060 [Sphingomicrobium sp.]|nr:hypothetical protein [Sphingomicrobium sp.]
MNPFEMVVLIVAIVMIATVVKSRHRSRHVSDDPQERAETLRLREEVKQLKERLHVLERIATDRENTLAREIEELRDR